VDLGGPFQSLACCRCFWARARRDSRWSLYAFGRSQRFRERARELEDVIFGLRTRSDAQIAATTIQSGKTYEKHTRCRRQTEPGLLDPRRCYVHGGSASLTAQRAVKRFSPVPGRSSPSVPQKTEGWNCSKPSTRCREHWRVAATFAGPSGCIEHRPPELQRHDRSIVVLVPASHAELRIFGRRGGGFSRKDGPTTLVL
jgi:hypothetical protein